MTSNHAAANDGDNVRPTPVFMVGWDGATFDLIRPWVRQGKLPNIARLMETGVHGSLRSTIPPWTFPAWTSFMTGTNPGKHGVFDFTQERPGTYELDFVNGSQRRGQTFWKILSEAGRQVVSISVPCTYPPEAVNGVMISGFDAPGKMGRGACADARGMHPPELYEELRDNVGEHPIGPFVINEINQGRLGEALDWTLQVVRQKAATAKYLLTQRPWDCFMILFGESDAIGHHFWKYCDPASPLFTAHPPGLADSILQVYQEMDRQLAELLELIPPQANVLMMSDHGFGGVSNHLLFPNCWLHERGFLRFRGPTAHRVSRLMEKAKLQAVARLPNTVKRFLQQFGGRALGGFETRVRLAMIDWSGTEAYFEENPYYPAIRINLKGRQPRGIVPPGEAYEALRDRIIEELEAWQHPETGKKVVEKAYRREEVYSGPCLEQAPDIVPKWALHEGYSYAFKLSSKSPDLAWTRQADPNHRESHAFFTGKSGTHRDDGIFVAQGPDFREGAVVEGARIIDLAPTILHLLDLPIPQEMDGVVLQDAFSDVAMREFRVQEAVEVESAEADDQRGNYAPEDEDKIAQRLRSLGYLD